MRSGDVVFVSSQVEEEAPTKGRLTVAQLEPNTSYTCQGGMLVGGSWLYSPKALRMTENSGPAQDTLTLSLLVTLAICNFNTG